MEHSSRKKKDKKCVYAYVEMERSIDSLLNPNKEFILFKCGMTKYKSDTRIKQVEKTTGTPESATRIWTWYDCPVTDKKIHNLFYHLRTYDEAGVEWFCFSPNSLDINVAIDELRYQLDCVTGRLDYIKNSIKNGPKRKEPVPPELVMTTRNADLPYYLGSYEDLVFQADKKKKAELAKAKRRRLRLTK